MAGGEVFFLCRLWKRITSCLNSKKLPEDICKTCQTNDSKFFRAIRRLLLPLFSYFEKSCRVCEKNMMLLLRMIAPIRKAIYDGERQPIIPRNTWRERYWN